VLSVISVRDIFAETQTLLIPAGILLIVQLKRRASEAIQTVNAFRIARLLKRSTSRGTLLHTPHAGRTFRLLPFDRDQASPVQQREAGTNRTEQPTEPTRYEDHERDRQNQNCDPDVDIGKENLPIQPCRYAR
jgi:hypothetical protein